MGTTLELARICYDRQAGACPIAMGVRVSQQRLPRRGKAGLTKSVGWLGLRCWVRAASLLSDQVVAVVRVAAFGGSGGRWVLDGERTAGSGPGPVAVKPYTGGPSRCTIALW